jgi:hypothetical protein
VSARGTTGAITTAGEAIVSSAEADTLAEEVPVTMVAVAVMPDALTLADVQVAVVDIMAERVQVVADAQVAVVDAQVAVVDAQVAADIPAADIQAVADPDNRINLTATQLRPRHLCRGLSFSSCTARGSSQSHAPATNCSVR